MIRLSISDYSFLQDVPLNFNIEQVTDKAKVTVFINGSTVYATTLLQHNGVVTFYGLQEILAQHMLANKLPLTTLRITAELSNITETFGDVSILYCGFKQGDEISANFYNWHFLTNRTYYVIPRSAYHILFFFDEGQEAIQAFAECVFEKDNSQYTLRVNMNNFPQGHEDIHGLLSGPGQIFRYARQQIGNDCGKLLAYTIHVGKRAMTIYVTDEEPLATFCFRNAYNIEEYAFVFGTETYKTIIDRKEASCQGKHSFYNQSVERKHEVTTAPLSLEEAHWMNELFESHHVTMEVTPDYDQEKVLISDITSEISNRADEKVRLKFTWWFDDNSKWIFQETTSRVFNNNYIDTFK